MITHFWKFTAGAALALVFAGCASAPTADPVPVAPPVPTAAAVTPSSAPTVAPTSLSTAPTRTPAVEPVQSNPLTRDFQLMIEAPAVPKGSPAAWDAGLMDPGAVTVHEGTFYMFYNAVRSWPGAISVGLATSPDGRAWTRVSEEPLLSIADIPWRPVVRQLRATSILVQDGTWALYFTAATQNGTLTGSIGRATAPSPAGPWTVDSEPVLTSGQIGEWDGGQIGFAKVLPAENGYVMYYTNMSAVGLATSPDGVTWTKYDDPATTERRFAASDPVLVAPGLVEDPSVMRTDAGLAMVFRTGGGLRFASSADGVRWAVDEGDLVVSGGEGREIFYSALVSHDGTVYLYFEAGGTTTSVYMATWGEKEAAGGWRSSTPGCFLTARQTTSLDRPTSHLCTAEASSIRRRRELTE